MGSINVGIIIKDYPDILDKLRGKINNDENSEEAIKKRELKLKIDNTRDNLTSEIRQFTKLHGENSDSLEGLIALLDFLKDENKYFKLREESPILKELYDNYVSYAKLMSN